MIILRAQVPALMRDRYRAPDLAAGTALVHAGALSRMFRSLPALAALWVPA